MFGRISIMFLIVSILIFDGFRSATAQVFGSNFLTALRGYGNDICRFVSCQLGQYCWNGVCQAGGAASGGPYGATFTDSLTSPNILCADSGDCLPGQICQAGRCAFGAGTSYSAGYGNYAAGYGALAGSYLGGYYPMFAMPSGVQSCTLMQECANGQICVNGYCSQSNIAISGSQAAQGPTTCATGAICPIGQYCLNGICIQNYFSTTFACASGLYCPAGMNCFIGRCISNGLQPGMFWGKKK